MTRHEADVYDDPAVVEAWLEAMARDPTHEIAAGDPRRSIGRLAAGLLLLLRESRAKRAGELRE